MSTRRLLASFTLNPNSPLLLPLTRGAAATREKKPMTKNEYNGWHNYETWCVNLWLTNDSGTAEFWENRAKELWEESDGTLSANARLTGKEIFTTAEKTVLALEKELKAEIEDNSPLSDTADIYTDLLNAAFSEVNWHEIAKAFVENIEKEMTTRHD